MKFEKPQIKTHLTLILLLYALFASSESGVGPAMNTTPDNRCQGIDIKQSYNQNVYVAICQAAAHAVKLIEVNAAFNGGAVIGAAPTLPLAVRHGNTADGSTIILTHADGSSATGFSASKHIITPPSSIIFNSNSVGIMDLYPTVLCIEGTSYCYFFGGDNNIPTMGIIRYNSLGSMGVLSNYLRISPDYYSLTDEAAAKPGTSIVVYGKGYKRMLDLSITSNPPLLLDTNLPLSERCYHFAYDGSKYFVGEQGIYIVKYDSSTNASDGWI